MAKTVPALSGTYSYRQGSNVNTYEIFFQRLLPMAGRADRSKLLVVNQNEKFTRRKMRGSSAAPHLPEGYDSPVTGSRVINSVKDSYFDDSIYQEGGIALTDTIASMDTIDRYRTSISFSTGDKGYNTSGVSMRIAIEDRNTSSTDASFLNVYPALYSADANSNAGGGSDSMIGAVDTTSTTLYFLSGSSTGVPGQSPRGPNNLYAGLLASKIALSASIEQTNSYEILITAHSSSYVIYHDDDFSEDPRTNQKYLQLSTAKPGERINSWYTSKGVPSWGGGEGTIIFAPDYSLEKANFGYGKSETYTPFVEKTPLAARVHNRPYGFDRTSFADGNTRLEGFSIYLDGDEHSSRGSTGPYASMVPGQNPGGNVPYNIVYAGGTGIGENNDMFTISHYNQLTVRSSSHHVGLKFIEEPDGDYDIINVPGGVFTNNKLFDRDGLIEPFPIREEILMEGTHVGDFFDPDPTGIKATVYSSEMIINHLGITHKIGNEYDPVNDIPLAPFEWIDGGNAGALTYKLELTGSMVIWTGGDTDWSYRSDGKNFAYVTGSYKSRAAFLPLEDLTLHPDPFLETAETADIKLSTLNLTRDRELQYVLASGSFDNLGLWWQSTHSGLKYTVVQDVTGTFYHSGTQTWTEHYPILPVGASETDPTTWPTDASDWAFRTGVRSPFKYAGSATTSYCPPISSTKKSTPNGMVYDNAPIGYDSIAFGGYKK